MTAAGGVERAVEALEAGELVVLPTDTVYGLACRADEEDAVQKLSELKRRSPDQPVAILAASVKVLVERVPRLRRPDLEVLEALLPGPWTFVVANPARRFPWLAGARGRTLGVRVPALSGAGADVLARLGVVAATSANLHGGPDPRRLDDVPVEIRDGVAALVDGGELPGTSSTVVDLTAAPPKVLRPGAMTADEALARVAAVLGE